MPVVTHLCIAIKLANLSFLIKPLQSRMHLEILLKYDFLTLYGHGYYQNNSLHALSP